MKNPFFINFIIIMSLVCVFSVVLWEIVAKVRHRKRWIFLSLLVTLLSSGMLWQYGLVFPTLSSSTLKSLYFSGAMATLIWFLAFWLAFPLLLVLGLATLLNRCLSTTHRGGGLTRREFLKRAALVIPGLALFSSAWGNIAGEHDLETTYHSVHYPDLPDYLAGYKIGQLSDLHLGLFFSPQRLQEALDALAGYGVNRLVITGDVIDELSLLPETEKVLQANVPRFPDGVDFCYGNHEYYRGPEEIAQMLRQAGVRVWRNEAYAASPGYGENLLQRSGKDSRPFYLAAVDYSFARGEAAFQAQREAYVEEALKDVPAAAFTVLLAHHPVFFDEAAKKGVQLTLSGHTHGAQFAPIGPLVAAIGFKYLRGWYQKGTAKLYVNRGTGHWLPFRLGCSREASVFELQKG